MKINEKKQDIINLEKNVIKILQEKKVLVKVEEKLVFPLLVA